MIESLDRSFGLTIAFLLPGFLCLVGFSAFSPALAGWLSSEPTREPSLGGFLYVVLGSLATGLIVSAVRWAAIDTFHHATGIHRPDLNFRQLTGNLLAYQLAVEYSYRYYQFYSNVLIANIIFAVCYQSAHGLWPFSAWLGFLSLEVILLAASRDCLSRFYRRGSLVLGTRAEVDAD